MDTLERAKELTWYHTLELAPDYVTEGIFDLRGVVDKYGLPEDMTGMRALDVGTWDGFWAFEMERRGAEVTALDLDWEKDLDWPANRRPDSFPDVPRGSGFAVAKEIFDSKVERVNCSIYNAYPEDLGTFDVVFCASVIIHLRDAILAMERIANLTKGRFISVEGYDRLLSYVPIPLARYRAHRESAVVFWDPNPATWTAILETSGFSKVERKGKFRLKAREGYYVHHVAHVAHK